MKGVRYAIRRECRFSFDEADRRVRDALRDEGFGVLTEIDVHATLKQKLGVEIEPYRILGACNPVFALQALTTEPDVGLLLPCNVVVRVQPGGPTIVEAIDPAVQLEIADNHRLDAVADQVRARLVRALDHATSV